MAILKTTSRFTATIKVLCSEISWTVLSWVEIMIAVPHKLHSLAFRLRRKWAGPDRTDITRDPQYQPQHHIEKLFVFTHLILFPTSGIEESLYSLWRAITCRMTKCLHNEHRN